MIELTHFITHVLSVYYGIEVTSLTLLPIGADVSASVYKIQDSDSKTYFVKLKRDHFNDALIATLELLQGTGIQQFISPIRTKEGKQIQQVGNFTFIVYPFIEGQDGFSCPLTDNQWITLGKAVRQVHAIDVPESLKTRIRREDFLPKRTDRVRSLYAHYETLLIYDEIASNLWKFLQEHQPLIQQLVVAVEALSQKIRGHPFKYVFCHADIHAGNVLVGSQEAFYIVDWDDLILAPKERDLMFIGGGVGNVWNKPHEERLFYQGYGPSEIDWTLLSY